MRISLATFALLLAVSALARDPSQPAGIGIENKVTRETLQLVSVGKLDRETNARAFDRLQFRYQDAEGRLQFVGHSYLVVPEVESSDMFRIFAKTDELSPDLGKKKIFNNTRGAITGRGNFAGMPIFFGVFPIFTYIGLKGSPSTRLKSYVQIGIGVASLPIIVDLFGLPSQLKADHRARAVYRGLDPDRVAKTGDAESENWTITPMKVDDGTFLAIKKRLLAAPADPIVEEMKPGQSIVRAFVEPSFTTVSDFIPVTRDTKMEELAGQVEARRQRLEQWARETLSKAGRVGNHVDGWRLDGFYFTRKKKSCLKIVLEYATDAKARELIQCTESGKASWKRANAANALETRMTAGLAGLAERK